MRLVEQVVLQQVVHWAHPVWREDHIDIVEEGEECFSRLEVAVHGLKSCPLAQGEQGWHEGIALFPAFCLRNFVGLAVVVVPNVCRCGGVELANKSQAGVGSLHLGQCL